MSKAKLMAYQGKADCVDPNCRRLITGGKVQPGCLGWHCPTCDAPISMYGHDCPKTNLRDAIETLILDRVGVWPHERDDGVPELICKDLADEIMVLIKAAS